MHYTFLRCSNCKDVPKQIEGMPQNSEAPHRPHNVHYKNVIARYFVLCRLYSRDKEQDDIGSVYHKEVGHLFWSSDWTKPRGIKGKSYTIGLRTQIENN